MPRHFVTGVEADTFSRFIATNQARQLDDERENQNTNREELSVSIEF